MYNVNNDSNDRPTAQSHRPFLHISSTEDQPLAAPRPSNDRPSVFSWRDDSCWSVSENTKSRDFRRKRYKKQKGEYLATKAPPPEVMQDIIKSTEEGEDDKQDKEPGGVSLVDK